MSELLVALRGAKLLATGWEGGRRICHYLLPSGKVLEVMYRAA